MAPPAGGKRKRGDRSWSGEGSHDGQRPSPHRPGNLHLAQHNHNQGQSSPYGRDQSDYRGRGGRRSSRGGRGSGLPQTPTSSRSEMNTASTNPLTPSLPRSLDPILPPQTNGVQDSATAQSDLPQSQPVPALPPRTFDYSYLTDELLKDWKASGRTLLKEKATQFRDGDDTVALSTLFQELIYSGVYGRLAPAEAGSMIKDVAWIDIKAEQVSQVDGQDPAPEMTSCQLVLLDTISIIAAETESPQPGFAVILQNCGVPPAFLRQELDIKFLEKLGLVRSTFARMGVRKTTNLLYRQANFNLLREESEGFAKVITELFNTSSGEPPTGEVVEETVERVKALIGSFDLDVGRALDVVLDVFGSVLVRQYRFFVKFLRASPWWPRQPENRLDDPTRAILGGLPDWALPSSRDQTIREMKRRSITSLATERDERFWNKARETGIQAFYELGRSITDTERHEIELKSANSSGPEPSAKEKYLRDWIEQTGTPPPRGNKDAAQLLGFKLRFYSSSAARTENDILPDNLIYLAALLIKIGFISLTDLYCHIWKSDEEMEALKEERTREKAERERAARPGQGVKNALLMAGALTDDTLPVPSRLRETATRAATPSKEGEAEKASATAEKKDVLPEPADQKVHLLKSLLTIGALPESLFIIGKFPWILDLYPEMPLFLNRIIHHSLNKVYDSTRPLTPQSALQQPKPLAEAELGGPQKGNIKLTPTPQRKVLRWALLDQDDNPLDGLDYRFYWDEWSDSIPVCQTVDDVFTLCDTFINLAGTKIGQDPSLLLKLVRIGKKSTAEDKSEQNMERWIALCKRLLVPALSLTKANPGVVNEVYAFIGEFPIDVRFSIYQEWALGRTSRLPAIKSATDLARAETRDTLKRISKTNVRPMARALAKIAYSNPHIVVDTAISQIEVYDNLTEAFVECARYFTDLGYDVLTWSLISALGRAGRSRLGESGLTTSRWLSALALFASKMFKRYPVLKVGPVLQYVTNQLIKGNPTDLVVLERTIYHMAGIITDASYNDAQLVAMGGGEFLRSQILLQMLDTRHESQKSSRRLMKALKESDLAGKLLLAIAAQRQACIFASADQNPPLKYLGNLFDELQRVFTQYLDLLHSNLSTEELEHGVPDVCQLIVNYNVQPEIAFWIGRLTLFRKIEEFDKNAKVQKELTKVAENAASDAIPLDLEMTDSAAGDSVTKEKSEKAAPETTTVTDFTAASTLTKTKGDISKVDRADSSQANSPAKSPEEKGAGSDEEPEWHPVLESIMDSIASSVPAEVSDVVGMRFYVTFWQLSLYEVSIPAKSYFGEIDRHKDRVEYLASENKRDKNVAMVRRREAEQSQLTNIIDRYLKENKEHLKAHEKARTRLLKESKYWFSSWQRDSPKLNVALLEHCFLPRLLLSPMDAFFCFRLARFLHTSATKNFRTMGFYDTIFNSKRLTSLIFMCTSKEADNLGRFLGEILKDLGRWHAEIEVYEKEAWGAKKSLPGFARKLRNGKPENFLGYEDFRRLLFKWHQLLFTAMQACLSSPEYMHIRNAISVLKAISQDFPKCNFHGHGVQKLIQGLGRSEQPDISLPSLSLLGDLNKGEKSWILPQEFRIGQEKASDTPNPEQKVAAQTPSVEQPNSKTAGAIHGAEGTESVQPTQKENGGQNPNIKEESAKTHTEGEERSSQLSDPKTVDGGAEATTQQSHGSTETEAGSSSTRKDSSLQSPSGFPAEKKQTESKLAFSQGRSIPPRPVLKQPPPNLPDRPERFDSRNPRVNEARTSNRPPSQVENHRDRREGRVNDRGPANRYNDRVQDPAEHTSFPRPHDRRLEHPEPNRDRETRPRSLEREIPPRHPAQDRRPQVSSRENGTSGWDSDRSGRPRPPQEPSRNRIEEEGISRERPGYQNLTAPPRGAQSTRPDVVTVNPERAALIGEESKDRNGISIRGQGEERSARQSRPTSPKNDYEPRSGRPDQRDDRPAPYERRGGDDRDARQRDRHEHQSDPPSRNFATERPLRSGEGAPREPRRGPSFHHPPVDINHGRLNQEDHSTSRQQEQSDHPEDPNDVPLGPRGRNSAAVASRGRNAPSQISTSTQRPSSNQSLAMGAPDRPAPTGPAARSHTRSQSFQGQPPANSPTAADTAGIHPDRLQKLVSPTGETPSRPSFHPSGPSTVQPSPTIPAGPRATPPSGAPLGPQGNGRGNRNALTAVQNTLQQAGQGQSIRGRGNGKIPDGPSASHNPGPNSGPNPSNTGPRSEVSAPSPREQARPDLFASRGPQDSVNSRRPPPSQQRRDDVSSERVPSGGRRGDIMDDVGDGGKRAIRRPGDSRERSPAAGDGQSRRNERGNAPYRDRENHRNDRDGDARDQAQERNRDLTEPRSRDGPDWSTRDSNPRRDEYKPLPPLPPSAPQRRSTRRDGPPADLPPRVPMHEDHGRPRRGYQSGPPPGPPPPGANPSMRGDDRERDRDRRPPSDRDLRDRDIDRGLPPPRELRNRDRDRDRGQGDLPSRKHPRADDGSGPYDRGPADGPGRSGVRNASENKRPRRGG